MTPHDWASKKVETAMERDRDGLPYMHPDDAARLLRNEHQRTVRVVNKLRERATFDEQSMSADQYDAYMEACADILHKLKEGRP